MFWKAKLRSLEDVAGLINSGSRIYIAGAYATPYRLVDAVVERAAELEKVLFVGKMLTPPSGCSFKLLHTPGLDGRVNYESTYYARADHQGTPQGNTTVNSLPLSKTGWALEHYYKIDTLMVNGSEPDAEGNINFGGFACGWAFDVARYARRVIICINKNLRPVKGEKTSIHVSRVHCLCRDDLPIDDFQHTRPSKEERAIAELIVPLIPDGACLQVGMGGLSGAVTAGLHGKRDLSVYTEALTDSMIELIKQGVISGPVTAGVLLGSGASYDYCAGKSSRPYFVPLAELNDFSAIASCRGLVSINPCLMADLTGQICSESLGPRQYSASGGQTEFARGAAASKGGKSFLCLSSTFSEQGQEAPNSKIHAALPLGAVVTTARSDVMYVVTEYGIADLYMKSIEDRVGAMLGITHPAFREDLRRKAVKLGIIRE